MDCHAALAMTAVGGWQGVDGWVEPGHDGFGGGGFCMVRTIGGLRFANPPYF